MKKKKDFQILIWLFEILSNVNLRERVVTGGEFWDEERGSQEEEED
jgi:hypothetical protein